jgi:tetratricopeptide (TPR) repeat protein
MPAGMEWSMLSKDEKLRLRGLSKEHAENIGLHILAAYALEEEQPEQALEHAQWVARQASRVDIARETLAFISYRAGDYKTALKEFRTARRMNGQNDYLPFIADCERGLGNPKKTIEIALSEDAKTLEGDSKAEMLLVFAGAYADLGHLDQAIKIVTTLARSKGVSGGYRMRAVQAEQYFLDQAGRHEESLALEDEVDRLEEAYADEDDEDAEEDIVDNDLEEVPDSVLEGLGIDLNDFREDEPEEDESAEGDESADDDSEPSDGAEEEPEEQSEAQPTESGQEQPEEEQEAESADSVTSVDAAEPAAPSVATEATEETAPAESSVTAEESDDVATETLTETAESTVEAAADTTVESEKVESEKSDKSDEGEASKESQK